MSDSNTPAVTVNIGSYPAAFGTVVLPHTKREVDATTGKKKSVPAPKTIVAPLIDSIDTGKDVFIAMVDHAESLEAGNGLKLVGALLTKRFEDASDASFDMATGHEDWDKYINMLVSPERPRSSGLSLDDINRDLADYAIEVAMLAAASGSADGWKELKNLDGSPLFNSQGQFVLRLSEVSQKIDTLQRQREEKQAKSDANKKAREAKAAAAAVAAKAAAAAVV